MKIRAELTITIAVLWAVVIPASAGNKMLSEGWRNRDFAGLVGLASSLYVHGDQAGGQRTKLAELITSKYIADAELMRSGSISGWRLLVMTLSKELSGDARARWARMLVKTFAGDAKHLAGMTDADMTQLVAALGYLGVKNTSPLRAAHIAATTDMSKMTVADIMRLSGKVRSLGKSGSEMRGKFLGYLRSPAAGENPTIGTLALSQWSNLFNDLQADMTGQDKSAWLGRLRAKYVPNSKSVGAMKYSDFQLLVKLLSRLGDKQVSRLHVDYAMYATALDSCDANILIRLARDLSRMGAPAAPARVRFAAHINDRYLAQTASAASLTIRQWRDMVDPLSADMSAELKASWAAKLRSVFASGKSNLLTLGAKAAPSDRSRRIDDLAHLLSRLGDKNAEGLRTSVEIATLPDFTALSGDELAACASRIERLGQPGAKVRADFITHIRKKHLASDAAAKTLALTQWRSIALMMRRGVQGRIRLEFVARLRSAFASDQKAVGRMSKKELGVLIGILRSLGDPEAGDLEITHIEASGAWEYLTAERLADISRESSDDMRARIIDHVENRYLTSSDGPKNLTACEWDRLATALAGDLSAGRRTAWVSKITRAFLDENMTSSDLSSISSALRALGRADTSVFVNKWISRQDGWKSWKPKRLVALVARSGRGPETDAWRNICKSLVPHVSNRYFADPAAIKDLGLRDVSVLVNAMAAGLPGETRFKWAGRIRSAFVPNAEAIIASKLPELRSVISLLARLGDPGAEELTAVWMDGNSDWRASSLSDLTRFTRDCLHGKSRRLAIGRTKVAKFISENKLNSPRHFSQAGLECVEKLVVALASDLDEDARAVWARGILDAFAANEQDIQSMDEKKFTSLARTIGLLDKKTSAAMTTARLSSRSSWSNNSIDTLLSRMKSMALTRNEQTGKLIARLDAELVGRDLDWETCRTVSRAYAKAGDRRRAQLWTKRMYETILGSKKSRDESGLMSLYCLADDLYDRLLTRKGIGYNEYAAAVAERARQGSLGGAKPGSEGKQLLIACHSLDFLWGAPLQSAESQKIVRDALIDPEGVARVKVGKVLSWSYRNRGPDFKAWKKHLDDQLARKDLRGDARAAWLMIKAHCDAVRLEPVNPARGIPWLKQAVIAAESEPLRLAVVDELTAYLKQSNRPDLAMSFIESIKHQFSGKTLSRLETIVQTARRDHQAVQARNAANRASQAQGGRTGRATYYRMLLARAERSKDRASAERIKTAIAKLYE